jgi:hypothetical protein
MSPAPGNGDPNRANLTMDAFVARQPIFDRKLGVFAYELLFRSGPDACFPPGTDIDYASSRTVSDGLTLMGLDTLARGKRAFINVSRKILERSRDGDAEEPRGRRAAREHRTGRRGAGGVPAAEDGGLSARARRLRRAAATTPRSSLSPISSRSIFGPRHRHAAIGWRARSRAEASRCSRRRSRRGKS